MACAAARVTEGLVVTLPSDPQDVKRDSCLTTRGGDPAPEYLKGGCSECLCPLLSVTRGTRSLETLSPFSGGVGKGPLRDTVRAPPGDRCCSVGRRWSLAALGLRSVISTPGGPCSLPGGRRALSPGSRTGVKPRGPEGGRGGSGFGPNLGSRREDPGCPDWWPWAAGDPATLGADLPWPAPAWDSAAWSSLVLTLRSTGSTCSGGTSACRQRRPVSTTCLPAYTHPQPPKPVPPTQPPPP